MVSTSLAITTKNAPVSCPTSVDPFNKTVQLKRRAVSRVITKNLPAVSNRLTCMQDEGSVGSSLCFRVDTTRACFHAGGKYFLRRTALNTSVKKDITSLGRYLRIHFVIQFGPGAFQTFSLFIPCRIAEGFVGVGSLAGP